MESPHALSRKQRAVRREAFSRTFRSSLGRTWRRELSLLARLVSSRLPDVSVSARLFQLRRVWGLTLRGVRFFLKCHLV